MKKLLTLGALAVLAVSAYGQGLVTFNNRDTVNNILAPVTDDAGTTLSGAAANIALLGGPTSFVPASLSSAGTLLMLASPNSGKTYVSFRTGTLAGFAAVGADSSRVLSNVGFGADAQLQLVSWTGVWTDWASAFAAWQANPANTQIGFSAPWTVHTGADALAFPPINTGMAGFKLTAIPEPSTMALAGLGAAALLIFRRRK